MARTDVASSITAVVIQKTKGARHDNRNGCRNPVRSVVRQLASAVRDACCYARANQLLRSSAGTGALERFAVVFYGFSHAASTSTPAVTLSIQRRGAIM